MPSAVRARPKKLQAVQLAERLHARRGEIEDAIFARACSVADVREVGDPEYARSLRGTIHTAVGLGMAVLDDSSVMPTPVPVELTAQARLAARNSVGIDIVLRRYLAGYTLLCDYVLQSAHEAPTSVLQRALRTESALLDRVLAEVAAAYTEECTQRRYIAGHRRTECVRRLLAGGPEDASQLGYELDQWHVGVVAVGPGAARALRELAVTLDRRLLLVTPGNEEVWAWLGGHRRLEAREAALLAGSRGWRGLIFAVGEAGRGASAWRLTHRQARLALSVAKHGESPTAVYPEVALLASILGDGILEESLRSTYLKPLEDESDGGVALRATLKAYLTAGRNTSSAAAALGVSRQTIRKRVSLAEEKLGLPIASRAVEIETALRLPQIASAKDSNLQHP